jgi:serine/threonine protein kinase
MDQLEGGSLSKLTSRHYQLSDDDASAIIRNILQGLEYIHKMDYIHRDLKPDNIIYSKKGDPKTLKIVDFGLGVKFELGSGVINELSGTLLYMPPEQATSNKYGNRVDIWACGIIMYILVTGNHPLYEITDTKETYIQKLNQPKWEFPSTLTSLAIHFFQNMCHLNYNKRYDAAIALRHPWITRNFNDPVPLAAEDEYELKRIIEVGNKIVLIMKLCYLFTKSFVPSSYKDLVEQSNELPLISIISENRVKEKSPIIRRKRSSSLMSNILPLDHSMSQFHKEKIAKKVISLIGVYLRRPD